MPGMIDGHVHATLVGEEGLLTYARLGVTTIKDLGGVFDQTMSLRERSRAGTAHGARVLAVGAFVEGDPPSWGGAAGTAFSGMEVHQDDADIERTISRNLAAGVNGIKLYAALPPRLVRRAIEVVDRRVPVTGHLTATTATEAIEAGIDGLEHLQLTLYRDLAPDAVALAPGETMANPGYWAKVRRGWEEIDPKGKAVGQIAALMASRQVRLIPTLVLGARVETGFDADEEAAFTELQRQRLAARPAGPRPSPADLERSAGNMIAVVEQLRRAGVAVLPGTDCGAVGVPPGYGYHMELALLAKAMPNAAVRRGDLRRGCVAASRRSRTIAPGKRADVVLIDGDPLREIADTRRITAVWLDGARLDSGPGRDDD